ncbi:hypothetical protein AN217_25465 [Streptomyces qinglanensis]|uniref:Ribosome associated membrane protein RAMP4 n=1 Tax=Streptomyces qinglanensis TaxID=943816 RepID=A0A1E7K9H9_9ACTN|nr:hypothetical protein [Streptomyces qinglanensis]OEV00592.1 hypothetical protein AN217_25465 [Streptomyces qinglanensis]
MSPTQTTLVQVLPLAKDLDENKVTPGVLGFVVFALIGAAVWMLMKSMNKHMRRVDFEEPAGTAPAASTAPAAAGATGGTAEGTDADGTDAADARKAEATAPAPSERKG